MVRWTPEVVVYVMLLLEPTPPLVRLAETAFPHPILLMASTSFPDLMILLASIYCTNRQNIDIKTGIKSIVMRSDEEKKSVFILGNGG